MSETGHSPCVPLSKLRMWKQRHYNHHHLKTWPVEPREEYSQKSRILVNTSDSIWSAERALYAQGPPLSVHVDWHLPPPSRNRLISESFYQSEQEHRSCPLWLKLQDGSLRETTHHRNCPKSNSEGTVGAADTDMGRL